MNILRKLRVEAGLTIAELAAAANVHPSTISELENDNQKANPLTLGKLAKALGVSVLEFAELENTTAKERGKLGGRPKKAREQRIAVQAAALLSEDDSRASNNEIKKEQEITPTEATIAPVGAIEQPKATKIDTALIAPAKRPRAARAKKKTEPANYWLLVAKSLDNFAESEFHGPLTEKSASQLAANIKTPTRIYQADSAGDAGAKHLAWLTQAVREGSLNAWLIKNIQS